MPVKALTRKKFLGGENWFPNRGITNAAEPLLIALAATSTSC